MLDCIDKLQLNSPTECTPLIRDDSKDQSRPKAKQLPTSKCILIIDSYQQTGLASDIISLLINIIHIV